MPNIRMLTSRRELMEKERLVAQGTLKARRNVENDNQDVAKKTNVSEAARTAKKADRDASAAGAELKLATKKADNAKLGAVVGAIGAMVTAAVSVGIGIKDLMSKPKASNDGSTGSTGSAGSTASTAPAEGGDPPAEGTTPAEGEKTPEAEKTAEEKPAGSTNSTADAKEVKLQKTIETVGAALDALSKVTDALGGNAGKTLGLDSGAGNLKAGKALSDKIGNAVGNSIDKQIQQFGGGEAKAKQGMAAALEKAGIDSTKVTNFVKEETGISKLDPTTQKLTGGDGNAIKGENGGNKAIEGSYTSGKAGKVDIGKLEAALKEKGVDAATSKELVAAAKDFNEKSGGVDAAKNGDSAKTTEAGGKMDDATAKAAAGKTELGTGMEKLKAGVDPSKLSKGEQAALVKEGVLEDKGGGKLGVAAGGLEKGKAAMEAKVAEIKTTAAADPTVKALEKFKGDTKNDEPGKAGFGSTLLKGLMSYVGLDKVISGFAAAVDKGTSSFAGTGASGLSTNLSKGVDKMMNAIDGKDSSLGFNADKINKFAEENFKGDAGGKAKFLEAMKSAGGDVNAAIQNTKTEAMGRAAFAGENKALPAAVMTDGKFDQKKYDSIKATADGKSDLATGMEVAKAGGDLSKLTEGQKKALTDAGVIEEKGGKSVIAQGGLAKGETAVSDAKAQLQTIDKALTDNNKNNPLASVTDKDGKFDKKAYEQLKKDAVKGGDGSEADTKLKAVDQALKDNGASKSVGTGPAADQKAALDGVTGTDGNFSQDKYDTLKATAEGTSDLATGMDALSKAGGDLSKVELNDKQKAALTDAGVLKQEGGNTVVAKGGMAKGEAAVKGAGEALGKVNDALAANGVQIENGAIAAGQDLNGAVKSAGDKATVLDLDKAGAAVGNFEAKVKGGFMSDDGGAGAQKASLASVTDKDGKFDQKKYDDLSKKAAGGDKAAQEKLGKVNETLKANGATFDTKGALNPGQDISGIVQGVNDKAKVFSDFADAKKSFTEARGVAGAEADVRGAEYQVEKAKDQKKGSGIDDKIDSKINDIVFAADVAARRQRGSGLSDKEKEALTNNLKDGNGIKGLQGELGFIVANMEKSVGSNDANLLKSVSKDGKFDKGEYAKLNSTDKAAVDEALKRNGSVDKEGNLDLGRADVAIANANATTSVGDKVTDLSGLMGQKTEMNNAVSSAESKLGEAQGNLAGAQERLSSVESAAYKSDGGVSGFSMDKVKDGLVNEAKGKIEEKIKGGTLTDKDIADLSKEFGADKVAKAIGKMDTQVLTQAAKDKPEIFKALAGAVAANGDDASKAKIGVAAMLGDQGDVNNKGVAKLFAEDPAKGTELLKQKFGIDLTDKVNPENNVKVENKVKTESVKLLAGLAVKGVDGAESILNGDIKAAKSGIVQDPKDLQPIIKDLIKSNPAAAGKLLNAYVANSGSTPDAIKEVKGMLNGANGAFTSSDNSTKALAAMNPDLAAKVIGTGGVDQSIMKNLASNNPDALGKIMGEMKPEQVKAMFDRGGLLDKISENELAAAVATMDPAKAKDLVGAKDPAGKDLFSDKIKMASLNTGANVSKDPLKTTTPEGKTEAAVTLETLGIVKGGNFDADKAASMMKSGTPEQAARVLMLMNKDQQKEVLGKLDSFGSRDFATKTLGEFGRVAGVDALDKLKQSDPASFKNIVNGASDEARGKMLVSVLSATDFNKSNPDKLNTLLSKTLAGTNLSDPTKMADTLKALPPAEAAKILQGLVNNGNADLAANTLDKMRNSVFASSGAAEVLKELSKADPKAMSAVVDKLSGGGKDFSKVADIIKNDRELAKSVFKDLAAQGKYEDIAGLMKSLDKSTLFGSKEFSTDIFAQLGTKDQAKVLAAGIQSGKMSVDDAKDYITGIVENEGGKILAALTGMAGRGDEIDKLVGDKGTLTKARKLLADENFDLTKMTPEQKKILTAAGVDVSKPKDESLKALDKQITDLTKEKGSLVNAGLEGNKAAGLAAQILGKMGTFLSHEQGDYFKEMGSTKAQQTLLTEGLKKNGGLKLDDISGGIFSNGLFSRMSNKDTFELLGGMATTDDGAAAVGGILSRVDSGVRDKMFNSFSADEQAKIFKAAIANPENKDKKQELVDMLTNPANPNSVAAFKALNDTGLQKDVLNKIGNSWHSSGNNEKLEFLGKLDPAARASLVDGASLKAIFDGAGANSQMKFIAGLTKDEKFNKAKESIGVDFEKSDKSLLEGAGILQDGHIYVSDIGKMNDTEKGTSFEQNYKASSFAGSDASRNAEQLNTGKQIGGAKAEGPGRPTGLDMQLIIWNMGMPAIQFMLQQLDKLREAQDQMNEATAKVAAAHKLKAEVLKLILKDGKDGGTNLQGAINAGGQAGAGPQ